MMDFSTIYNRFKNKLQYLLSISIKPFSFLDQLIHSFSDALYEAYKEIEKNKTPHIYSGLTGTNIDGLGMLIGCHRYENESDKSYLARVMAHHKTFAAANQTAIEMALTNLRYVSHASYTPFAQGTGTAIIHFIPVIYDDITIRSGIAEINDRLKKVASPDSYIPIEVAKPIGVKIAAYAILEEENNLTTSEIKAKVKEYINSIPIGDTLSYGAINRIGLSVPSVKYFNVISILLDNEKAEAIEIMQTIQYKFLFDEIHIEVVEN